MEKKEEGGIQRDAAQQQRWPCTKTCRVRNRPENSFSREKRNESVIVALDFSFPLLSSKCCHARLETEKECPSQPFPGKMSYAGKGGHVPSSPRRSTNVEDPHNC